MRARVARSAHPAVPRTHRLTATKPSVHLLALPFAALLFLTLQHILKYTGGSAFNPGASGSALTPGEITGIVTGVLLLVGIPLLLLAAVAGFFIVRKVRRGGYARQDAAMARDIRSGLTDGGNSSVTASYTDL